MTSILQPIPTVTVGDKFLYRLGEKFSLKGMRLPEVSGTLDFSAKLRLLKRVEELAGAHTSVLVLTEAQAEPVLRIAGQAGLYGLVEISVSCDQLISAVGFHALLPKVAQTANVLRSHPALMGYLINYMLDAEQIERFGIARLRSRIGTLCQTLRRGDRSRLIAVKRGLDELLPAANEEDVLYACTNAVSRADLGASIRKLHEIAAGRPVVIEFGEELPDQDATVERAFGLGAAGVVAPTMRPAPSSGWLNLRMLSAREVPPFAALDGACPALPANPPLVTIAICARGEDPTLVRCLESVVGLRYPRFEVIVVECGPSTHIPTIFVAHDAVRVLPQLDGGLSAARNAAIRAARGDLVAFIDPGGVLDSDWLTLIVRTMSEGNFDGCGGTCYTQPQNWIGTALAAAQDSTVLIPGFGDPFAVAGAHNFIFRRTALLRAGGYDCEIVTPAIDLDLFVRMRAAGMTFGHCPAAVAWRIQHDSLGSWLQRQRDGGRAVAALLRKHGARTVAAQASLPCARVASRRNGQHHCTAKIIIGALAASFTFGGALARAASRWLYQSSTRRTAIRPDRPAGRIRVDSRPRPFAIGDPSLAGSRERHSHATQPAGS